MSLLDHIQAFDGNVMIGRVGEERWDWLTVRQ